MKEPANGNEKQGCERDGKGKRIPIKNSVYSKKRHGELESDHGK
jgi:hypothetical protein